MSNRMAIVEGIGDQFVIAGERLVHGDDANLVIQLMHHGDLSRGRLNDFERVGRRHDAGNPVGYAEFARRIGD